VGAGSSLSGVSTARGCVDTPAEALKAQKRKRLQLEASQNGFEVKDLSVTGNRP